MLQISTGKFFTGPAHETLRRAILYTNYYAFNHTSRIETQIGVIQPAMSMPGLSALISETVERLPKAPGSPRPGELIATSGEDLINDVAALISFSLNIVCTRDLELAKRLIASEKISVTASIIPQKFVPRIFNKMIMWSDVETNSLKAFVDQIIGLKREVYVGVIRAIRQYVVAMHRLSDDADLAYALLVMSMESLAQGYDAFSATWDDYDHRKRSKVDHALEGLSDDVKEKVRTAILDGEHIALRKRFQKFVLANVQQPFFRTEAASAVAPISRPDLSAALNEAYAIRSRYVHHLAQIPRLLKGLEGFHESVMIDGRPTLTFAGLMRVARHVICSFVAGAPKIEKEECTWWGDVPGMLSLPPASPTWIGNADYYDRQTAPRYLSAFVEQCVGRLMQPAAQLTDMRPVLAKIESLVGGLAKPEHRLPVLALYCLFNAQAPEKYRSDRYPELFEQYRSDFDEPSIVGLAIQMCLGSDPEWSREAMENLHTEYFATRHHAGSFRLGSLLEAAFTLRLAEQNQSIGNLERAKQLIAFAVEAAPHNLDLKKYELSISGAELGPIQWQQILLPTHDNSG